MPFQFQPGTTPLLISIPHAGLELASNQASRMTRAGRQLVDTDWHVDHLYDFASSLGAGVLVAGKSRYVVDLNRSPDDRPLYAGAGSGLVPVNTFAGDPLYLAGEEPDGVEESLRVDTYWRPYHQQLNDELNRLVAQHGHAILLDGHSIISRVPRLFDGTLPDLNLGTFDRKSCAPDLIDRAARVLGESADFSFVLDGRFKGGYITRHYGRPDRGVHALQLEIAQSAYMDEDNPEAWDVDRALPLIDHLRRLVETLLWWTP